MDSAELLRLLDMAISEKEKAQGNYEKYSQDMNNKTLRKLIQGVMQREEGHLAFLNSFRESIRQQGDLDATILSAEDLLKNSPTNEQQLELLKMIMEGAGNQLAIEDQSEIRREESVQEANPNPVLRTTASQQSTRPDTRYARNFNRQSRSVVSCHINSNRTVSKKTR